MFHFHKWSDWLVTEKGKVVDYYYRNKQKGTYLIQSRYCHKCGKTQIDRQSTVYLVPGNYRLVPDQIKNNPQHDKVNS